MHIHRKFSYATLAVALSFVAACGDDPVEPIVMPDDIRTAASAVNVGGVNFTMTATAQASSSGPTQWVVRLTPEPGRQLPDMNVVEVWYLEGTTGDLAAITQAGAVRTDPANPYYEVQARGGRFSQGENVSVAVTIFDRLSQRRYARATTAVQPAAP